MIPVAGRQVVVFQEKMIILWLMMLIIKPLDYRTCVNRG